MKIFSTLAMIFLFHGLCHAEAPIESLDLSSSSSEEQILSESATQNALPRIQMLERRITQLQTMQQEHRELMKEVMQLRGQVDILTHQLTQAQASIKWLEQASASSVSKPTSSTSKPASPPSPVRRIEKKTPHQEPSPSPSRTFAEPSTNTRLIVTHESDSKSDEEESASPESSDSSSDRPNASVDPNLKEEQAYQKSYELLQKGNYPAALADMQSFLKRFPHGEYSGNAYFWIGELALRQNQPDLAVSSFQTVLKDYPLHPKVPDAMLKLGFAYAASGDTSRATTQLLEVQKQFKGTSTAQLAHLKLKQIQIIQKKE